MSDLTPQHSYATTLSPKAEMNRLLMDDRPSGARKRLAYAAVAVGLVVLSINGIARATTVKGTSDRAASAAATGNGTLLGGAQPSGQHADSGLSLLEIATIVIGPVVFLLMVAVLLSTTSVLHAREVSAESRVRVAKKKNKKALNAKALRKVKDFEALRVKAAYALIKAEQQKQQADLNASR